MLAEPLFLAAQDPSGVNHAISGRQSRRRRLPEDHQSDPAECSGEISNAFVYIDPPYLISTRRGGKLYSHEMTDAQHEDLLKVIRRLPCNVAISGYHSPMYSATLDDWRIISFQTMTRGGFLATEHLWVNYPEPTELHDYQFLGNNKRERERIKRKSRNLTNGLDRLPRLERQAIVRSITSR